MVNEFSHDLSTIFVNENYTDNNKQFSLTGITPEIGWFSRTVCVYRVGQKWHHFLHTL